MKLLLDTHIFLWYVIADPKLPVSVRDAIRDPANEVFLSSASVWEAVIKHAIGKLPLPGPPASFLPQQRILHRIDTLPVDESAVLQLSMLPILHRDPFDRILIAQAIQRGLTLATVDDQVRAYAVSSIPVP